MLCSVVNPDERPQNRDFITGFGTIGSEIIDENFKYDLEEKRRNVDE